MSLLSLIIVDKETKVLLKMAKDRVEEELGKELTWDEFFEEIVERLGYYDLFDFPKEDLTPDYLGEEEIEEPKDFCCLKSVRMTLGRKLLRMMCYGH